MKTMTIKENEKIVEIPITCISCRYYEMSLDQTPYSSWTGPDPASEGCIKLHWNKYLDDSHWVSRMIKLMSAQTCKDYKFYKEPQS